MMDARRSLDEVGVPTLLRIGPYRFHFYAGDHAPPHVHVTAPGGRAAYSLAPVDLVGSSRYTRQELRVIHRLVVIHRIEFLRRWYEHFDQ